MPPPHILGHPHGVLSMATVSDTKDVTKTDNVTLTTSISFDENEKDPRKLKKQAQEASSRSKIEKASWGQSN